MYQILSSGIKKIRCLTNSNLIKTKLKFFRLRRKSMSQTILTHEKYPYCNNNKNMRENHVNNFDCALSHYKTVILEQYPEYVFDTHCSELLVPCLIFIRIDIVSHSMLSVLNTQQLLITYRKSNANEFVWPRK